MYIIIYNQKDGEKTMYLYVEECKIYKKLYKLCMTL